MLHYKLEVKMSGYVISLAILNLIFLVFYFLILKYKAKCKINLVFILCIFTIYCATLLIQLLTQGSNSKAFIDTLPTSNISPFVFSTLPLCLLNKKLQNLIFPLAVFLSVGMLCSVEISHYRFIHDKLSYNFALSLDGLNHILYVIFGIYLITTNQVKLNLKTFLSVCGTILSVVGLMIVLNIVFQTSFFGLNFYGKHQIYNIVVCSSGIMSAVIYVTGLLLFLILGYLFQLLNLTLNKKFNSKFV